jgi:hypothetical protein
VGKDREMTLSVPYGAPSGRNRHSGSGKEMYRATLGAALKGDARISLITIPGGWSLLEVYPQGRVFSALHMGSFS